MRAAVPGRHGRDRLAVCVEERGAHWEGVFEIAPVGAAPQPITIHFLAGKLLHHCLQHAGHRTCGIGHVAAAVFEIRNGKALFLPGAAEPLLQHLGRKRGTVAHVKAQLQVSLLQRNHTVGSGEVSEDLVLVGNAQRLAMRVLQVVCHHGKDLPIALGQRLAGGKKRRHQPGGIYGILGGGCVLCHAP